MLGRFFRGGKVRPGLFFPRGKIYTGILFPGAILSRGGFSGGKFCAGGNSMLQHRHLVKSNPDCSLYLGPFLKRDRNPLSGIQVRSPVTTFPAAGYRNGESAQDHDG